MTTVVTLRRSALNEDDWRSRSYCLDVDPDTMHPDPSDRWGQEQGKAICKGCPVSDECFADGVRLKDYHSIRAGMTGDERKLRLKREDSARRRAQAAAVAA